MHAAGITQFCAALSLALACAASAARAEAARAGKVDFERHIMGLFGRLGCNAGSCHGSFQGKGGFRLSLFGYDPARDYLTLTRDSLARRINPVNPDQSLLLLKSTGQVNHGGGIRLARGSWQYQLFRRWIVDGARHETGSGDVAKIRVSPREYTFTRTGQTVRLRVHARFTDGSDEDVTALCDFRTNDDAVAEVSSAGQVKALRAGDTAIVVSYRGNVLPVRVLVPLSRKARYPRVAEANYIDHEVFAKLRRLNIVPTPLADDAEFLRRVTIDTIGSLPTPAEVRAFLADRNPRKRAKKIDALLTHPLHAALWATKFSDITGNNTDALEPPQQLKARRSQMWHDWFRKRVADNMPYDQIVKGVLCATSREGRSAEEWVRQVKESEAALARGFDTAYADRQTLDLFWRRQQQVPLGQWGQKTAAAFLGIRLECAECHKHPFDRWTQVDYRAYANVFGQVAFGVSPEARKIVDAENRARRNKGGKKVKNKKRIPRVPLREIFVGQPFKVRRLNHPETNRPLGARALGGPEIEFARDKDPRLELWRWLRAPDNPYFARSFVNRVWGHYFGVGIVEPVDNFSLANPPSNEKLLDALARDFIKHHFDIRRLERTILNARAYQLTSSTNATNRLDRNNYAHGYVRPMMAEVFVDVLNTALGVTEKMGAEAPAGCRAIEIGASRVQNPSLAQAFRLFGRPPRTSACDCERALEPALPQTLYLMTDPTVLGKLPRGRLQQLLSRKMTDEQILEELFLATLSRYPTEADKNYFAEHRAIKNGARNPKDRRALFVDTLWALINTREFRLNH